MSARKKIVFVVNYFYPDLASTGQLMTELCLELQQDFEITVIAAQPGYAGEVIKKDLFFEKDKLENIEIIRLKLPPLNKNSKTSRLKYITSYFFLATSALLKERKIDIIFTISQPPVLGGLIGSIGKLLKRSIHIYNIQDFNPEQAAVVSYTKNQTVLKLAKAIDKLTCRYADNIILVGQDMKETLKHRFKNKNVPKHSVINNWTDESEILPLHKSHSVVAGFLMKYNLLNKFVVMYSGNLGLFYDLENIMKVAKEFEKIDDLMFVFIGEGALKQKMEEYAKINQVTNVLFLTYQPKEFIRYSLNAADLHLVVNQKGIKGISVPSKIYGVMAAGKPILGVLEQGSEAARLILESQAGVVVEPQEYNGIISSIDYFYKQDKETLEKMGRNGRLYLENYFTKQASINKYRILFKSY
ncbi:glycosyltransferase family 4 protein [Planococcus sp. YIM B11945]|uniref:glycosyltransferase family 4 protein n=1 Tax=Planococcus sp. YIM B11945 TaxID=3435410 RepID=UPI003D7EBA68